MKNLIQHQKNSKGYKWDYISQSCRRFGLFEIQDEGSQIVSESIPAQPKQQILDLCAGAGGKSLAIAPKMQNSGQLYLHDVRANAIQKAKVRLLRAGVKNFTCIQDIKINNLDIVIVDAPCTGIGTLRRNPELKLRFNKE